MGLSGNPAIDLVIIVSVSLILMFCMGLFLFSQYYHKAASNQALIRVGLGGTKVSFSSMLSIPLLHKLDRVDLSPQKLVIERKGKEGLILKDSIRADIKVDFILSILNTEDAVQDVSFNLGAEKASDPETIRNLFEALFSEVLKTIAKEYDFADVLPNLEQFKRDILYQIGIDLHGYSLDRCAIDYFEQTPLDQLDPDNILDAQGLLKIQQVTSEALKKTLALKKEAEEIQMEKTKYLYSIQEAFLKKLEVKRQKAQLNSMEEKKLKNIFSDIIQEMNQ
ncbi:MAG: SPFH domain-containing protein [Bacteroidota bacterium]